MSSFPSRWCAPFLAALLISLPAWGATRLQDYTHTTWRADDGAPLEIKSMAQTPDGRLWLGTASGLYHFDGLQFRRVPLPKMTRGLSLVANMVARPDGAVWIADDAGALFLLHGGKLDDMTPALPGLGLGIVMSMAFDADGGLWAATATGLWHRSGGRWQLYRANGAPGTGSYDEAMLSVLVDQYGQVWAADRNGIYLLERGAQRLRKVADAEEGTKLTQSPDGRVWWIRPRPDARGILLGAIAGPEHGKTLARRPDFNQVESRSSAQFDRDGNLWLVGCPSGTCLVADAGKGTAVRRAQLVDSPGAAAAPSAVEVNTMLEDSAGNIWLATQDGLDRLRAKKVVGLSITPGKSNFSMAQDSEGNAWAVEAAARRAWKIRADGSVQEDRSEPFTIAANDRDGALLLAGRHDIVRRLHGVETRIPLPPTPDGRRLPLDVFGVLDDGDTLWIGASEVGVAGLKDGRWYYRDHWNFPRNIYTSAPAGKGKLWLVMLDGTVVHWDHGAQTAYDAAVVGRPIAVHGGPDVLVAGDEGIAVLQHGRFRPLRGAEPDVLRNVSGLGIAPDGDRWLNGARGIVHVTAADWRAAMADPRVPLRYTLIDAHDGYPGQAALENRLRSVFTASDGRMWFMTSSGIVQLDPRRLRHDMPPPVVGIEAVQAAGRSSASPTVRLPAGVQDFSIAYGAPSLSRADGLRFQYMLDGKDSGWQDGATRRTAWYTNIAPGRYTFRVRATNEEGSGSAADATTVVVVEPTLTQSLAFRVALAVAGAALLYLLYRQRLRVATRRIADRHDARLAERERIARTLHDTFLQSVQALVLRVHAAARKLPAENEVRLQLESVLDQADGALAEGRQQVYDLRSGRNVESVLEAAGRALAASYPTTTFALTVDGERMPLQAQVQDEIAEIGAEALRNAFVHARATHVTLTLDYGRDTLALCVLDDGGGIDEDAVRKRVDGKHWGLVGMRERAARIGGKLAIDGSAGWGTSVALTVPARLAYAAKQA
jgi:signal transduction histidine kinase/ligand-binding sensor domain-containing protein